MKRGRRIVGGTIITVVVVFILAAIAGGSQQAATPPAPTPPPTLPPSTPTPAPPLATATTRAFGVSDLLAWAGVISNSLNYCELAIGMRPWTHTELTLQQMLSGAPFSDNPTPRNVCREEADELTYDTPPVASNAAYDRLDHARKLLEQWAIAAGDAAGDTLGVSNNPPPQDAQGDLTQGEAIIVSEAKKMGAKLNPDTLLPPGQTPHP